MSSTAKQSKIFLRVIIDTRERDLKYVEHILKNSKDKENITLNNYKIATCRPLGCRLSTGDITYEYSIDNINWFPTSFAIELKKGMDLFSTLWSNYPRFKEELERAKSLETFYIIHDYTYNEIITEVARKILKGFSNNEYSIEGFTKQYINLCITNAVICTGKDSKQISLGKCIRRMIKEHFKSHKKHLLELAINGNPPTKARRRKWRKED